MSDEAATPSLRRGSYYVSAFDLEKGVAAGYYLLAGPWPTHAEALA